MHSVCPECGTEWHVLRNGSEGLDKQWTKVEPAFCPGCGARMAERKCRVESSGSRGDGHGGRIYEFRLSCGHSVLNQTGSRPAWCPACGARVDGDETDTKEE